MTQSIISTTKTKFKVFFDRIRTPHREEAMNRLLERVDEWQSAGCRTILSYKWRHMAERGDSSTIYVEVEIIYRETTTDVSDDNAGN